MPDTYTCPACGAASTTSDYCDSCGAAIGAPAPAPAPASSPAPAAVPTPAAAATRCPSCGAERTPDDAFCEVCGLDFATGKMPAAPPAPAPASSASGTGPGSGPAAAVGGSPSGWTAVIEADRTFFESNQAETPGAVVFPENLAAREVELVGDEVLIGRRSDSRGLFPAIDLGGPAPDPAVSHRHALLRRQPDGAWALLDEGSSNGTYLNDDPTPVANGVLTVLHDGDRIHVGAFTTITIRHDAAT